MGMLTVIKNVPKAVVKTAGKTMWLLKKAKPQILVGGGIVVATGAFMLAIVNARKIDKTIEESNAKVDEIEQKKKDIENAANLDDAEKKTQMKAVEKELNKARSEAAWKMFVLLGVPVLGFAGGIAMTIGGHKILLARFGQLSASFAALQESYQRYRQMNIQEHGEECDRRYRYGIVDTIEGKSTVTDETGKEKTVKTQLPVVDGDAATDIYCFEFSQRTSRKCPRDPVSIISFLRTQEKYWNTFMQGTGKPVTLSMVLQDLGIDLDPDDPKMDYILIAGWRPNGDGDGHIDFGIMRAVNKPALNLESDVVYLNFNCDGNIYHSARYDKTGKRVTA